MLKGELNILGYSVFAELIVNPASRIKALVMMDPIDFAAGVIQVTRSRADTSSGPLLDLDIKYGLASLVPSFGKNQAFQLFAEKTSTSKSSVPKLVAPIPSACSWATIIRP